MPTDNFNRANGPLGANWTNQAGSFEITSNTVIPDGATSGTEDGAYWNAQSFNNDQYSQATFVATNTVAGNGVCVRCATSTADTWYGYYGYSSGRWLFKMVNGTWTQLGTAGGWTAGNVVRIEASGTTITPKINGALDTGIGAKTDSSIASGSAGITGWGDNAGAQIDDWEGDNLGGADASLVMPSRRRAFAGLIVR